MLFGTGGSVPRKPLLVFLLLAFLAGIACWVLLNFALSVTNETEFCVSCHAMRINLDEYKETAHYKNPSGVRTVCADCHVPKALLPMLKVKVAAIADLYHHAMGTLSSREKYEARRWEMANREWTRMRRSASRECRSCHAFAQMDLAAQSRSARNQHGRAVDEGKTCIDCHQGIAHKLPIKPKEQLPVPTSAAPGAG